MHKQDGLDKTFCGIKLSQKISVLNYYWDVWTYKNRCKRCLEKLKRMKK